MWAPLSNVLNIFFYVIRISEKYPCQFVAVLAFIDCWLMWVNRYELTVDYLKLIIFKWNASTVRQNTNKKCSETDQSVNLIGKLFKLISLLCVLSSFEWASRSAQDYSICIISVPWVKSNVSNVLLAMAMILVCFNRHYYFNSFSWYSICTNGT